SSSALRAARSATSSSRRKGCCSSTRSRTRSKSSSVKRESKERAVSKFDLSGRVAIVTGVGRSIVEALAEAGADVAVAGRQLAPMEEAVAAVEEKGRRGKAYCVDLRSVAEIRTLVDDVVRDFGDLHILVNNAGVQLLAPAEEMSEADWDETLATNLKAP